MGHKKGHGLAVSHEVRFDDLVSDIAAAAAEVAPRPDMAAPKALRHWFRLM
jgi:hypothetical protein